MTSPMQRSRHSDLPEGPGFTSGFTNRVDSQRDLWRFLLPYGHLQAASLRGGGVVDGLRVSATAGSPGLLVTPGQALDGRGRLLAVIPAGDDLAVRLRRVSTADVGAEGLASVGADGVAVPTTGLSGEYLLVLEWNETRLTLDGETVYRLTPWLRLERPPAAPKDEWVVLARVTLGSGAEEGRVTALDAGLRRALPSLRDGLTLSRPQAVKAAGALRVEQAPAAALRWRTSGGLDISTWNAGASAWRTSLSVGGARGNVAIGLDTDDGEGMLDVAGAVWAEEVHTKELVVDGTLEATDVSAGTLSANAISANSMVNAGGLTLESMRMPIVRAGSTDPATTPWFQNDVNELFVRVDTSSGGFTQTPIYTATLNGARAQQVVTGVTSITNPTPKSFDLFIRTPTLTPSSWSLSVQFAKDSHWFINWIAVLPR